MAIVTLDDVRTRLVTNKAISDPATRQADWAVLVADITETFGAVSVDRTVREALQQLHQRV